MIKFVTLLQICCHGYNFSCSRKGQHDRSPKSELWCFTFTVSNDAPSRITTSRLSAMRSCRLRRCFAGFGSYSSKCSRPRFFSLEFAIAILICTVAGVVRHIRFQLFGLELTKLARFTLFYSYFIKYNVSGISIPLVQSFSF